MIRHFRRNIHGTDRERSQTAAAAAQPRPARQRLKSDEVPYPETKSGEPDVVVEAIGRTWSWELSTNEVPVGKVIEFAVSTEDVNHGFGIYSPEGKILAQVQVMPGYKNRLRYRFEKEGEYKILCMEYCGVSHHNMIADLRVVSGAINSGEVK